jgi:hypothetical protein
MEKRTTEKEQRDYHVRRLVQAVSLINHRTDAGIPCSRDCTAMHVKQFRSCINQHPMRALLWVVDNTIRRRASWACRPFPVLGRATCDGVPGDWSPPPQGQKTRPMSCHPRSRHSERGVCVCEELDDMACLIHKHGDKKATRRCANACSTRLGQVSPHD